MLGDIGPKTVSLLQLLGAVTGDVTFSVPCLKATFTIPTSSDSDATAGSIFLSTDHLDTNSAPKLCRKDSSGNITVIG